MASKPTTDQTTHSHLKLYSEQTSSFTDSDSQYDSQSQSNNSYEDESFSDDPDDSDQFNYGYVEDNLANAEHSLNTETVQSTTTHSPSFLESSYSSPIVPSLSPLQLHTCTGLDQTNNPEQFTLVTPTPSSIKHNKGKRSSSPLIQRDAKRLEYLYNPSSSQVNPNITVAYIGETDSTILPISSLTTPATIDPTIRMPVYYLKKTTDWQTRKIFNLELNRISSTGLLRMDLYVYAVEANAETQEQCGKDKNKRNMTAMNTPIERFYPDLWQLQHQHASNPVLPKQYLESLPYYQEPYANALSVIRKPDSKFAKVPLAIEEPTHPLHTTPPAQQHSLSEQGKHLLECNEPIQFFEAVYRAYEFKCLVKQTNIHRTQQKLFQFKEVTYDEMRCFIGLLLWTSLVQLSNRRSYFKLSKIYQLPHFVSHMTRNRFEELFRMLHLANNNKIPPHLDSARRFKAKLGKQLKNVCANSTKLLSPARALSIDEMMVKFYGRSVVRQYIPAKPHKYGVKLWAICCSCCGYSLTQNLYLGGSVIPEGGRDVILELTEPYYDKGHVIYCDRFFTHLDLEAYLRARSTGFVGTANTQTLPLDLQHLVSVMHPLTWAYKWYNHKARIETKKRKDARLPILEADEPICLLMWMDKKYRTQDKKVLFITNCLPAIPTSAQRDCHRKNIRDENKHYTRQLISSPPILKAYNYRMGGVDRHDRLVGQHSIPLTTKRGYMKVFYHLLDSAVVNAWILYKTAKQEKSEWNMAAKERHNLAWFKESVILSLCGDYTARKKTYGSMPQTTTPQVGHSLKAISKHQIQPIANIPEYQDKAKMGRCCLCNQPKRTACIACLKVYCYECGRQHLEQLMSQSSRTIITLPPIVGSTTATTTSTTTDTIQTTHESDSDSEENNI